MVYSNKNKQVKYISCCKYITPHEVHLNSWTIKEDKYEEDG